MNNILVIVYSCTGTSRRVAELLARAPILSSAVTVREVDDGSCADRLQAFGTAVSMAENSRDAVRPVALSPQSI